MRIRMAGDGKVFSGTPVNIVERMRESCFEPTASIEEYLQQCCKRSKLLGDNLQYDGQDDAEKCLSFVLAMVKGGQAKIELDLPKHLGGYAIIVIRKTLGLSQEQLANKLKVSFTTVNRWERGKTRPRSLVHLRNIARLAKQIGK